MPDTQDVDQFIHDAVVHEAEALAAAREHSHRSGLPGIEVSPSQGAFLGLLVEIAGARRVLEIGTLGGYSTIWLARAVGESGRVITLEIDPAHARVARENIGNAGLDDRVEVRVGPAADSLADLTAERPEPFDLVFIDADKPSNSHYLEAALRLSRPGTVIVVDNVVRRGKVADLASQDASARGSRSVLQQIGAHPRLDGTALQTVGSKGWDGFALAVVR